MKRRCVFYSIFAGFPPISWARLVTSRREHHIPSLQTGHPLVLMTSRSPAPRAGRPQNPQLAPLVLSYIPLVLPRVCPHLLGRTSYSASLHRPSSRSHDIARKINFALKEGGGFLQQISLVFRKTAQRVLIAEF